MTKQEIIAVIPARFASTRLPGKMLADVAGKPLVQRVWEGVSAATLISRVIIATDHQRIFDAARKFGAEVVMTNPALPSGTDRAAVAMASLSADWIVNVQGDEPLLRGEVLDDFVARLSPRFGMATLARRLPADGAAVRDPNVVKVVCGLDGRALYFSRAAIPFRRDADGAAPEYWQHIGIYAYQPATLRRLVTLPASPLERVEKLEQLRALQNGVEIQVLATEFASIGVDTAEDLRRVAGIFEKCEA
ncbi:MAG: 3-deoxy-manno-octulosonate cytidylyltransferase [Verrucomicrobiales bacterium]|jgi:3-deoxy-manno-octulosonate cytidylyltransferase (CMP-KDO synthetase)|nr:3-deoxy-manno-octulosonate cytidylyltransferase [Verrucomicrobiales bacterium]